MSVSLKHRLTELYTGSGRAARRFRFGLIIFDFVTILLFVALAPMPSSATIDHIGLVIGLVILFDFSARMWIAEDRWAVLRKIYTLADIVVILSLLAAPFITANVAFLRILRGLRIIHSYHLLRDLRRFSPFFMRHEDALIAAVNLFVFVFFTTSVVYAMFVTPARGVEGYIDALYFTVSTLTTTGYGDITPTTQGAKLFSVFIMVIGVALFVQLARAIILPNKVTHECQQCGLLKHERDAVHCKHCGAVIHIRTEGLS